MSGDERDVRAEEAGLHGHELRLAGLTIDVDLVDLADLVVVGVDQVLVDPLADVVGGGHALLPWWWWLVPWRYRVLPPPKQDMLRQFSI
jgi:hypothetical protein